MKILVFAIVGFVVLAMAGTYMVGRFVMSAANHGSSAVSYPPVYTPSYVPNPSTPEWEALERAQAKGMEGRDELRELMTTPDEAVAQQAALELFKLGGTGSEMFFEELPEISTRVKEHLRHSIYGDWQFELARLAVEGPGGPARDGAALFLRLPYSRNSLGSATRGGIGDTLVEAIPGASGTFADDLAFTIGLYPPSSLDGLKKHLGSGDSKVRLLAVRALGKLGDEAVLGEVERMRYDGAAAVSAAAYVAASSIEAAARQRALIAARSAPGPVQSSPEPVSERQKAKKRLGMP